MGAIAYAQSGGGCLCRREAVIYRLVQSAVYEKQTEIIQKTIENICATERAMSLFSDLSGTAASHEISVSNHASGRGERSIPSRL